jgi:hypothetical protein
LNQFAHPVNLKPLALGTEAQLPARHLLFATVAALGLFGNGCDKQPQSNSPPAESTAEPAPTTTVSQVQARKDLPLVTMPIVLSAPEDWKLRPAYNSPYLQAATPDGDIQISLSVLDSMSDNSRRLYIAAAIDQSRKHSRRIHIRQAATDSGLQMLERITYANVPDGSPDQPPAATEPSAPLTWSIIIFVPFQKKFIPCRFDLLKLTQREYEDDQQFIETIIDTARPADLASFK